MKKIIQTYIFEAPEDSNAHSFNDEIPVHIFDGLTTWKYLFHYLHTLLCIPNNAFIRE